MTRRNATIAGIAVVSTVAALLAVAGTQASASVAGPVGTVYVTDFTGSQVTPVAAGATTAGTPIQLGAGTNPIGIELTADGAHAYVADSGSDQVSPITLSSQTVGTFIKVGETNANSQYLAISPDNSQAYVANEDTDSVTPINLTTNQPGTPYNIGTDTGPVAVAFTPDGKTAFVANFEGGTVTPINTTLKKVGTAINVGDSPTALSITPDGATLYVVNYGSGTLTPITVSNHAPGAPILVGPQPDGIAITPDGKTAYVANTGDDTVTPVDLTTTPATPGAPIGLGAGAYPSAVAVSPDGATIYVSEFGTGGLGEISTATNTVTRTVDVGGNPLGLAVTPDQGPTAHLSVIPAPVGSSTHFDASGSTGGSSAITGYHWDFGDGVTTDSTTPTVTHVYGAAGNYTVTVTVTDAAGTSTTDVYTGQMTLRNGSAAGNATATFLVLAPTAGATPVVYATNYGSATVTPIATAPSVTAGSPIAVHPNPKAFAITPNGSTGYAVNSGDGTVVPINLKTNTPGTPISVGNEPSAIAITPDGTEAYVANTGSASVSVITLTTAAVRTISLSGAQPDAVAIDPSGTWVYVADLASDKVQSVKVANDSLGATLSTGSGSDPDALAIAPDGAALYVAAKGTNNVLAISVSGTGLGAITGNLSLGAGSSPTALAVNPDGNSIYVTNQASAKVVALSVPGFGITGITDLADGSAPAGIAVTPDGSTAFVAESGTNQVIAITLPATAGAAVTVGNSPEGIAITPDQAPIAKLSVTTALAGSPTQFDASASSSPNAPIVSYAWKFGDGSAVSTTGASTTTHTYAKPGDYTATVTLTDAAGTSTTQVFTGQTISRNGGPTAKTSQSFHIYAPTPTVLSLVPNTGKTGQQVTITGTWLFFASVTFGATPVPTPDVTVAPDGKTVTVYAPNGPSGTVNVEVTTPGPGGPQSVSAGVYTYLPGSLRPTITALQPDHGVGGTGVGIIGTDLDIVTSVTFNGINAPIEVQNPTALGVAAPPGTPGTDVVVAVHVGGTEVDAPMTFHYDAPTSMIVYPLSPFLGQPGTIVTIPGAGLGPATSVTFDGVPATIRQHSTAKLVVVVPPGTAGSVVTVTVHAGAGAVDVPGGFMYQDMIITRMTPRTAAPGATVTLKGTGLRSATSVTFGGVNAVITTQTAAKLVVVVPPGVPGSKVTVTVHSNAVSVPAPGKFTFQ